MRIANELPRAIERYQLDPGLRRFSARPQSSSPVVVKANRCWRRRRNEAIPSHCIIDAVLQRSSIKKCKSVRVSCPQRSYGTLNEISRAHGVC